MTAKHKTLAERIVGAGIVIAIAHLFLKFTGLIQAKAAAHFLSTSEYEPILVVAFTGVIGTLFFIGEEVIGPSFLPVFMREMDDKGEKEAWDFANVLLTVQAILLLVAVGSIMLFPDFFIRLFTDWRSADNPERYSLLRRSLVILAPCLFFLSIGSTTYMLLNGYKRFFLAAFGDASTKICVVIALFVGVWFFGASAKAVLFGLLLGSVAKLLTHLAGLLREMRFFRFSLDIRNPAVKTIGLLMLPLLAGIIIAKVRDNFNSIYSLSRYADDPGLLMANDLGRKLFASIQWLVPYALQIALFPFLCELVDKKDRAKLGEVLSTSCRHLVAVFVPGSIMIAVLAVPVSAFIFLGGRADFQVVVSWAGLATGCYILVLPAAAMECVLMQGFFADRKMVSVTAIGMVTSILSVLISFVFIVILQVEATMAIAAISLGFVASRYIKTFVLVVYLRRSVPMFPLGETLSFACRMLLVGAAVAVVTYGAGRLTSRVLPDGLDEARTNYLAATAASGSTTVAGVNQVLGSRLDEIIDPDFRSERLEAMREFSAALRGGNAEEGERQRARLLALVPEGADPSAHAVIGEAIDNYELVIVANAAVPGKVSRVRLLIKLAVASLAGLVAFLGSAYLLRVKEPFDMVVWTLDKALGKTKGTTPTPPPPLAG